MFTGIIEEVGTITGLETKPEACTLKVRAGKISEGMIAGDSISINGVRSQVRRIYAHGFIVEFRQQLLERTTLGEIAKGEPVNLERAVSTQSRFQGHLVQGNVSTVGFVSELIQNGRDWHMTVALDYRWLRYCLVDGPITVEGISLLISDISTSGITMIILPSIYGGTNLSQKRVGDGVNIEVDLVARYVERFVQLQEDADDGTDLGVDSVFEWGFGEG